MKNENKQRGQSATTGQNPTHTPHTGTKQPVKQETPGKSQGSGRTTPGQSEQARSTGKPSELGHTRQPVKNESQPAKGRGTDASQRNRETDPATQPEKTRQTPKA